METTYIEMSHAVTTLNTTYGEYICGGSILYMKDVTDGDCMHAKRVYKILK